MCESIIQLSPVGQIVQALWVNTSQIRPGILLDAFIVMPDHFHAIVFLPGSAEPRFESSVLARPRRSLGSLIAGYKSACTSRVNTFLGTKGFKVWQRNYHERVIRDARALEQMRRYITANPARWANDGRLGRIDSMW
jgi:REP element-mobilizing transposase RayT